MGDYLADAAWVCTYLFYFVQIIGVVCTILAFVTCPIETREDVAAMLSMIVLCIFIFLIVLFMKLIQRYFHYEETLYCEDHIIVRHYGRKDRIVTYREIGERVRAKGIRIRKGRLELPFKGGKTAIYVHEKELSWETDRLIPFLNKKCELSLPELTKEEQKRIRKTGVMPVCMNTFAAIWAFDFGIQIFAFVNYAGKYPFWAMYFQESFKEFCAQHIFLVIGMPFVVLGVIAELLNFIPVRICFFKHKIFKVR